MNGNQDCHKVVAVVRLALRLGDWPKFADDFHHLHEQQPKPTRSLRMSENVGQQPKPTQNWPGRWKATSVARWFPQQPKPTVSHETLAAGWPGRLETPTVAGWPGRWKTPTVADWPGRWETPTVAMWPESKHV